MSGRVDKAFKERAPEFEILADNEHIWMVHRDVVGPLQQGAADGADGADDAAAGAGQEGEGGPTAQRRRRRGRRLA